MDENRREKKKKKKEKSAIGYAISSRIGIYRDRGWPPPSYTRVERVVGREFSWSVRVRFPGRPFGRIRGRVWSGTRNTHFYQTLRGLERAGWKPISYTLVGIRRRYTSATFPSLSLYCPRSVSLVYIRGPPPCCRLLSREKATRSNIVVRPSERRIRLEFVLLLLRPPNVNTNTQSFEGFEKVSNRSKSNLEF